MHFLTRTCGLLFLAAAAITVILAIVDTAPEAIDAANQLREGNNPLPVATSVKYRIGSEVLTDVLAIVCFALFGWFLWTSEIQQSWAVVITALLLIASITVRSTPLLSIDVARHSPGLAFWGALVIDDYYPAPLAQGKRTRTASTFPMNQYTRLAVTERGLSGDQPHPAQSVILDFTNAPALMSQFYASGGAQITSKAAGTRTILDWDHDKAIYPVPHLMVLQIAPVGARSAGG
ncbi:MAG: hypothetical protein AB7Y46_02645 [Armatimonadota bacterium]